MPSVHYRACNLCEAMCGIAIEHEGETIVSIRGDDDDPFSRGHVCPKALGLKDVHEDPDRLKTPQKRIGDRWVEVPWAEAIEEAADRIHQVQRAHGPNAVALYQGNPTVHNYGSMLFGQIFARALRTRSRYSATSLDQLPQMLAALEMFDHQVMMPVPDLDRTEHLLVLGANPIASNGSIMSAPDVAARLRAIQARGGKIVVLDPRRTETAEMADEHVFLRPGTDAMVLAAMLRTIFAEGLARLGRLGPVVHGFGDLRRAVDPFTPEAIAAASGVPADTTKRLARDFASARRAACYGRVGVCTQEFGGLAAWLAYALDVVTARLDEPGGMMFATPAVDLVPIATRLGQRGHFAKSTSRVRGLPEFGGEWPVVTLAEEIETPGDGQIRALVTSAGNPVLSSPNGARLDRALATLDFMVSIDVYRNETTRHASLILPPTFALEHEHYDVALHAFAIRNTAKWSPAFVERGPAQRHDWEIFVDLGEALDKKRGRSLRARATALALRKLRPEGMLDLLLRTGPHRLSVAKLKKAPHGIDLGPLEPRLPALLPKSRIQLAPPRFVADLPRLKRKLDESTDGELSLIGRRELRSNNSWLHNSHRLVKGPDRCTLLMNAVDASARGLRDGDRVVLRSRAGAVEAKLEVTDEMMPGVVSLPHGWGHSRPGVRLRVAGERPGVSINDVTDELLVDELSGNARLNGVPVTVTAAKVANE